MEIREVLKIVRNLADAMWPAMQNDPEDVARQQLEAVRALAKAVAALETEEKSSMRKTYTPLRAGKPWSAVEDEELRTEFARKITIQEMASHHQRQRGGITARLERLGLISSQLAMNFAGPFGVLPNKHSVDGQKFAPVSEARELSARDLERPWLLIEDASLCKDFETLDMEQIAIRLGRTKESIQSRLIRLGKIEPRSAA